MIDFVQVEPYYVLLKTSAGVFTEATAHTTMDRFFSTCGQRRLVILDLSAATEVRTDALTLLQERINGNHAATFRIALLGPVSLAEQIEKAGLDRYMSHFPSLNSIISDEAPPTPQARPLKVDRSETLRFLKVTENCVIDTLKLVAETSVQSHSVSVMKDPTPILSSCAVGARIPLSCPQFDGDMYLLFPEETYIEVMSGFLGRQFSTVEPPISDGVSELLNIVAGDLKGELDRKSYRMGSILPTLLSEADLLKDVLQTPSILIEFHSDAGKFFIKYLERELNLAPNIDTQMNQSLRARNNGN